MSLAFIIITTTVYAMLFAIWNKNGWPNIIFKMYIFAMLLFGLFLIGQHFGYIVKV